MLAQELLAQREERGLLVQALGVTVKGSACRCPFHDDSHPSAGIFQVENAWKFRCHVCDFTGDVFDVRARMDGTPLGASLKAEPAKVEKVYPTIAAIETSLPNHEATYRYTNPQTNEIELLVFRYRRQGEDRKAFAQGRQVENGFVLSAPKGKLPIYNRTRIATASEVVIVEGEKCVHALHQIGITATTSPGGAGKSAHADWTPLAGKTVYLWPDFDEIGEKHMKEVARHLETLSPPCTIRRIDSKGLGLQPKGDCVDYLARNGGSREDQLIAAQLVLEEASPVSAASGLESRLTDIIEGRWYAIQWPWPQLSHLTQSLLPGTITVLPGDAGGSKSFMLLEAMWYWHIGGIKTALYELEEDRTYHLQRALAQLEENSGFTLPDWVFENAEAVKNSFARNRTLLDTFGRTIYDAPDNLIPLDKLTEWVEAQCQRGCEIIGIDPITAAQVSDKPWLDDQKFILQTKAIIRKYDARLILVTHPKKTRGKAKGTEMSDMAGGAAYERFSQTVMWLMPHAPAKTVRVSRDGLQTRVTSNRSIQIRKARNGIGTGMEVAFDFESRSLRFSEQGIVVPETADATQEVRS